MSRFNVQQAQSTMSHTLLNKQRKRIAFQVSFLLGIITFSATAFAESPSWQPMTTEQENQTWQYILNSPLGIAALNQLAIEGFISPLCSKKFYIDETGFQSLLKVECPEPRGVSTAISYNAIKVIFGRYEDNIENFRVERIPSEK